MFQWLFNSCRYFIFFRSSSVSSLFWYFQCICLVARRLWKPQDCPFALLRCQKAGQKNPATHYYLVFISHHIFAQIAIWVDPSKMATGKRTLKWKDDWLIRYRFWLGKSILHYCWCHYVPQCALQIISLYVHTWL